MTALRSETTATNIGFAARLAGHWSNWAFYRYQLHLGWTNIVGLLFVNLYFYMVLYGYSFTVLRTNSKQMKEKNLDRFKFPDELKEKLVTLVVYQNRLPKELSLQYGLPNAHMLVNWVNIYKKSLEKGAITLPPMQTKKKKDTPALKQRIKQLEKSLEKANVMIYGLNAMIDYAEKELKVPVRKKHGTK